jgi:hypothetical protein
MERTGLDRRAFVQGAAGTAAGLAAPLALPRAARAGDDHDDHDDDHKRGERAPQAPPKPIPGGINVWAPGPPTVTLPFTGLTLQGLDADPSTITDFDGFSAVAFHTGTATAADGTRFDLETDMRAYRGAYVDTTGTLRFGTFAFI